MLNATDITAIDANRVEQGASNFSADEVETAIVSFSDSNEDGTANTNDIRAFRAAIADEVNAGNSEAITVDNIANDLETSVGAPLYEGISLDEKVVADEALASRNRYEDDQNDHWNFDILHSNHGNNTLNYSDEERARPDNPIDTNRIEGGLSNFSPEEVENEILRTSDIDGDGILNTNDIRAYQLANADKVNSGNRDAITIDNIADDLATEIGAPLYDGITDREGEIATDALNLRRTFENGQQQDNSYIEFYSDPAPSSYDPAHYFRTLS